MYDTLQENRLRTGKTETEKEKTVQNGYNIISKSTTQQDTAWELKKRMKETK